MLPIARKDNLVIQEVDGEILVYDLATNKAISLNETSAIVWQNCDGTKGPAEIARQLQKETGQAVKEDMVWFAVNQLNKENLLKPPMDYTDKFAGMSRRDVIKKVGIGTMIALPVVASLIAPQAVEANSRCVTVLQGCACTNGVIGAICTPAETTMACASTNCLCRRLNNGGGNNGDCVP